MSRVNKGTLVVAISQDSCDQLVLINEQSENLKSWNRFISFKQSSRDINNFEGIFMPYEEKGIKRATDKILPNRSKAFCSQHIPKNLRTISRDNGGMIIFWKALKTYSPSKSKKIEFIILFSI